MLFFFVIGLIVALIARKLFFPGFDQIPENRCTRVISESEVVIDNQFYDTAQFSQSWWSSAQDSLGTLQLLNAARVPYFLRQFERFGWADSSSNDTFVVLDVGCGGGVCSEAVARQALDQAGGSSAYRPLQVLGVDISPRSLAAARQHASEHGAGLLVLDDGDPADASNKPESRTGRQALTALRANPRVNLAYVEASAYQLPVDDESVDAVLCSDVLEHLLDLPQALSEMSRVLKPGGVFVFDTINQTPLSHALAIVLAQEWLGLVPPLTHDWRLFVRPAELDEALRRHHSFDTSSTRAQWTGMRPSLTPWNAYKGLLPGLLSDFVETNSLAVNYLGFAIKL